MPTEPQKRVIVTIDDANFVDIDSVASNLQVSGMQVLEVLHSSGIIIGLIPSASISKLRSVNGVLDVEQDGTMDAI